MLASFCISCGDVQSFIFCVRDVGPSYRFAPGYPTVTTPYCVGVPVKRQQPINVIIEILH